MEQIPPPLCCDNIGDFEDNRADLQLSFSPLKERDRRPSPNRKAQISGWEWGPPSSWPSDEPFPTIWRLNSRSAQRWGWGQRMSPCCGQTGPERTVISITDSCLNIKGQPTLSPGQGSGLVSFCTAVRREVANLPQFSTQFSPSLSVGILPSSLGKVLGLPSLLPCRYFHDRISVLSVPLHKTLLYGKRQDIPISANRLWD